MEQVTNGTGRPTSRVWPRVLGLVGVAMATSVVVSPGVLIGIPLFLLLAARGFGNMVSALVASLVILMVIGGGGALWDGLWYAERAWTVMLGGCFLALTLLVPGWRLFSRSLAAAAGAAAIAACLLMLSSGGWSTLEMAVAQSMQADMEATLAALRLLGGDAAPTPEMVTIMQDLGSAQVAIFPALLGIESLAALGVAWWARARLLGESDPGLAPLRDFRFNDHLVWIFVLGLVLVIAQAGPALARVGTNTVVFMGALYALRGAAVFLFITGGISVLGSVTFALLLVFVPPVVLGTAALIGIGDTWLDLRSRAADQAA